jgi:flagellar FliL protein
MAAETTAEQTEAAPPRRRRLGPLVGAVLALACGGGAFYATGAGLVPGLPALAPAAERPPAPGADAADLAFVDIPPLVISLRDGGNTPRHLRFRGSLEVPRADAEHVSALLPRVTDLLNGYLRALSLEEIEDPEALVRLRAQMLRRIQVATGEGRVNDLLVMEFVIN